MKLRLKSLRSGCNKTLPQLERGCVGTESHWLTLESSTGAVEAAYGGG